MPELISFTSLYQSETMIVPLFGLVILVVPIILLIIGLVFSLKYPTYRKSIGIVLIFLGIFEILPFILLILGLNDILHFIPYIPLVIIFIEGLITLIGSIFILAYSKVV